MHACKCVHMCVRTDALCMSSVVGETVAQLILTVARGMDAWGCLIASLSLCDSLRLCIYMSVCLCVCVYVVLCQW